MKRILKISSLTIGLIIAFYSNSAFATTSAFGGSCVGDTSHICKVTSSGTTVYGYWVESTDID